MEGLPKEVQEYREVTERLIEALDRHSEGSKGMSNIAEVKINAGGVGILIVTALAAFMCGVCIFLAFGYFRQQKQIDDMHDYLNVIYQYAPQLAPTNSKKETK